MLMNLEMLDQLVDAFGQKRNLHFRRAGIVGMRLKIGHNGSLFGFLQRHLAKPPFGFVVK